MTQRTGKEQIFKWNGLNLTNSMATEITWSTSADEIDASTINSAGTKAYLQGPYESNFDISGVWDDGTAALGLSNTLYNSIAGPSGSVGAKPWDYAPGGSAADRPHYWGSAFLSAYEISGAVDGLVGFSCTLRTSGSVGASGTASGATGWLNS